MVETQERNKSPETEKSPEIQAVYEMAEGFDGIAIVGQNGAGKTVLANEIVRVLRNSTLLQGGKTMRERSGGTSGTVGFIERPPEVDKQFDLEQIERMDQSSHENPLVNESELAGLLAKRSIRNFITITVTAPTKIRIPRIRKRAKEEWEEKKDKLLADFASGEISEDEFEALADSLNAKKGELTPSKIKKEERIRREKDIIRWTKVWPELDGNDPMNPGTLVDGERINNFSISTAKKSKRKVSEAVIHWLLANGVINKIEQPGKKKRAKPSEAAKTSEKPPIANSGDVFVSDATKPLKPKKVKNNGSKSRGKNPPRGSHGGKAPRSRKMVVVDLL